jgi:hypothetical protein
MKKVMMALAMCLLYIPAARAATTLTVSLTYTYSTTGAVDTSKAPAAFPGCTTTLTTNCITGFNVYDTTTTRTLIGTVPNSSNPSGQQTMTDAFIPATYAAGSHTIVATTAYKDANGAAQESTDSSPFTFTVPVVANPGAPSVTVTVTVNTQ